MRMVKISKLTYIICGLYVGLNSNVNILYGSSDRMVSIAKRLKSPVLSPVPINAFQRHESPDLRHPSPLSIELTNEELAKINIQEKIAFCSRQIQFNEQRQHSLFYDTYLMFNVQFSSKVVKSEYGYFVYAEMQLKFNEVKQEMEEEEIASTNYDIFLRKYIDKIKELHQEKYSDVDCDSIFDDEMIAIFFQKYNKLKEVYVKFKYKLNVLKEYEMQQKNL